MDPSVQAKLLGDPQVQEAMKNAGNEALQSKQVQDAIMKAAKDTLTAENAQKVADKVKDWASDPELQAKARHYSGMAMDKMGQAGQMFVGCIEQGPAGLRFLAFATGVASCGYACLNAWTHTVGFNFLWVGISAFQVFFALTTMLFEASPEMIAKAAAFSKYQDILMEYAKFLSIARGRGAFYIFQGLMWLMQYRLNLVNLWEYVTLGIGGAYILMGILHIAMHYGILPQTIAAKAKEYANSYRQVPAASSA